MKTVLYTVGRVPGSAEKKAAKEAEARIVTSQTPTGPVAGAGRAFVPKGSKRLDALAKACEEAGQEVERFDPELWGGYQSGVKATDGARKLAWSEGFDLSSLDGSGSSGGVLKSQVEKALAGDSTDDSSENEDEE